MKLVKIDTSTLKGNEKLPTATVVDYTNGNYTAAENTTVEKGPGDNEVTVSYGYEYNEYESYAEAQKDYSEGDIVKLINTREKATANSGARQKAIAPFAQDPNSKEAIRGRMIKDAVKLGKTEAEATAFVDSLLAA